MNRDLISIIIPVYNTQAFLVRCIDSVVKQSYKNLEIILINDGSTDGSEDICKGYVEQDERIQLFTQANQGLSAARNTGIQKATGKYITFLDSDDYIHESYIDYLFQMLEENKADISICEKARFSEAIDESQLRWQESVECISGHDAVEKFCYHKIAIEAWGKLYHRSLFQELEFPVGRIHEDYGVAYKLFHRAQRVVRGQAPYYYYYQRPGSIINSGFSRKYMDRAVLTEEFVEYIEAELPELGDAAQTRAFVSYLILNRDCTKDEEFREEYAYIRQNLKKYARGVWKDKHGGLDKKILAAMALISPTLLKCVTSLKKNLT